MQPNDPDYPRIESAIKSLAREAAILCYTSQNLGEFWNACTRPADRNGYGLTPQETDQRARIFEAKLRLLADSHAASDRGHRSSPFIRNGAAFWFPQLFRAHKFMMRDW